MVTTLPLTQRDEFANQHTDSLRSYMSQFGEVEACTIMRDPDGKSRGYAFMSFKDSDSVEKVLAQGRHIVDQKMVIHVVMSGCPYLKRSRLTQSGLSLGKNISNTKEFSSEVWLLL